MKKKRITPESGQWIPWQKMLMVMRLLSLFIFASFMSLHADVLSQQKVNLQAQQMRLDEVLKELSRQTHIDILFNSGLIRAKGKVNIDAKEKGIIQVLDELLPILDLEYEYDNTLIIVREKKSQPQPPQQQVIEGRVTDERKNPLPGITVVIKGSTIGTSTDGQGHFRLRLPALNEVTLVFSSIGYQSLEVKVTEQQVVNVVLKEAITEVDEVVITGIFTKAKESFTGAVSSIKGEQLQAYRGQNLIQTLRNIDPAINIIANNEMGSNPNAVPQINIRGNSTLPMSVEDYNTTYGSNTVNTPLIIMDGFEISITKLLDYNDDEIESINILKDASATAIYGSRGANGVIVIISKAPAPGKLKINVQAGLSLEFPDLSSYDLLDAPELFHLQEFVGLYRSDYENTHDYRQQAYESRLKDILEGVDTDWLHYPVRTGLNQKFNARIEGGSEEFRWSTSLSYNQIQGAMKGSKRNTFNGSITLAYSYKNIVFKNQLNIGLNKGVESPYGSFSTYANMQPYYRPYDEEGKLIKEWMGLNKTQLNVSNPLYDAGLNTKNESKYTEIINNFSIDWNILKELAIRARFGISKKTNESDHFLPADHSTFKSSEYETDEGYFRKGRYTYGTGNTVNYEGNITLSYSRLFNNKHQLYAGLDFSIQNSDSYSYNIVVEGFPNKNQDFFGNALQYQQNGMPGATESLSRRVGFTGNMNYTYDNRYYVDFSCRMDGSSQFGYDKRFAPFWSAGIGWSLHREKFLENNKFITSLRLKASYGSTGSQNFSAYQALPTYETIQGDKYLNRGGAYLIALGNEKLKWQTTDQFNIGTEFSLLSGRIDGSLDYYIKKTYDLLSEMHIPRATGYSSYIDNIGEVKNTGFEVGLNAYLIRNTDSGLMWMVGGKISYNKNKITQLSDAIKKQSEEYKIQNVEVSTLFYEGYSQNSIWAVHSLGIDPSTGEELFFDADGNITTEWNPNAKIYCGISEPEYRGNLNSILRYKNFTLNLSFGYHWGGQIYNSTLRDKVEVTNNTIGSQNVDRRVLNARWSKPGDITFFKGHSNNTTYATSRFVMDDNVFELQSASLQYRLSEGEFLKKTRIGSLTFGIDMSDLFYLSSVKRERGTSYPFARRIGASLSVQF